MSRYSKINKKYHDNSFVEFVGPSHSQGGVKDSGIEYEGGETKYKDFVFSNRLKAAEGSMSAQSKKIFSKYKKKNDFMSRMSKQAELGEIAAIGEKLKAAEIAKQEQAMQAQQMQQAQQGMPEQMPEMPQMAFGGFDPLRPRGDIGYALPSQPAGDPMLPPIPEPMQPSISKSVEPLTSPLSLPPLPQPMAEPSLSRMQRFKQFAQGVPQRMQQGIDNTMSATGDAINAIGESGVINDSSGIAASMVPMMFRTMDALTDKPEQVPLFQNQQMYNSMDLMNNRIDSDAMLAESERQANAGRLANVSRSAQVNNAMSAGMYANQQAQNQQAALSIDMQNAQFRGQEAQMRAQMGAQDREYRAQQDDLQARTDAASEQRKDAGAQSLFNLVGTNLSQKRYLADSLRNKMEIAQMELATQEKIAAMMSQYGVMSGDFVSAMQIALDPNATAAERASARTKLKSKGVELGTIVDENPSKQSN